MLHTLQGVSLEKRVGVICARVGVLHVPRALTPGAFALRFLLPCEQKLSTL